MMCHIIWVVLIHLFYKFMYSRLYFLRIRSGLYRDFELFTPWKNVVWKFSIFARTKRICDTRSVFHAPLALYEFSASILFWMRFGEYWKKNACSDRSVNRFWCFGCVFYSLSILIVRAWTFVPNQLVMIKFELLMFAGF